jgi:hypothetical protein
MKRLPNFHSNVNVENYSPQVEKLLAEWEQCHDESGVRIQPSNRPKADPAVAA